MIASDLIDILPKLLLYHFQGEERGDGNGNQHAGVKRRIRHFFNHVYVRLQNLYLKHREMRECVSVF